VSGRHCIRINAGFSLLECLIVITLTVFLLLSVVIGYRQWIVHYQLNSLVSRFEDALSYARDSAMTLQTTTEFCPNNGDNQCGVDWQQGQLIIDTQNQHVLRVMPAISSGYAFNWHGTLDDSTKLRWRSDGFTRGQQGSFFIRDQHNKNSFVQMIILRTGRVRVVMHDGF